MNDLSSVLFLYRLVKILSYLKTGEIPYQLLQNLHNLNIKKCKYLETEKSYISRAPKGSTNTLL